MLKLMNKKKKKIWKISKKNKQTDYQYFELIE